MSLKVLKRFKNVSQRVQKFVVVKQPPHSASRPSPSRHATRCYTSLPRDTPTPPGDWSSRRHWREGHTPEGDQDTRIPQVTDPECDNGGNGQPPGSHLGTSPPKKSLHPATPQPEQTILPKTSCWPRPSWWQGSRWIYLKQLYQLHLSTLPNLY